MARRSGGKARWWLALGLLAVAGCGRGGGPAPAPTYPFGGAAIRACVVGDPRAVEVLTSALVGEWEATRKARITVSKEPVAADEAGKFDVVLFPGEHLGELVEAGALMVWPEKFVAAPPRSDDSAATVESATGAAPKDAYQFLDVVQAYRDQVSKYGQDRIGVPLGGTALVLAYHKAAFDRAENQEAAQKANVRLAAPRTWKELDALAAFFEGRAWKGDGKPRHGIAVVLGADDEGLGNAVFLARAAALGQHRDQYSFCFESDSMAPRIDTPPFVEALQGLLALHKAGPADMATFDGPRARRALAEGEVALLIDRAEMSEHWTKKDPVGVAPLPGSDRVFEPVRQRWEDLESPNRPSYLPHGGGWLVGVSAASTGARRDAAVDFAKYLTGPDLANSVRSNSAFPMLPVRGTALGQGPVSTNAVDARQWAEAVGRTLAAERVVPGLRIPAADGYLADLAAGRLAALDGEPAQAALGQVARKWRHFTAPLGAARQAWHYQRSLNSLVTTPQPPPR